MESLDLKMMMSTSFEGRIYYVNGSDRDVRKVMSTLQGIITKLGKICDNSRFNLLCYL